MWFRVSKRYQVITRALSHRAMPPQNFAVTLNNGQPMLVKAKAWRKPQETKYSGGEHAGWAPRPGSRGLQWKRGMPRAGKFGTRVSFSIRIGDFMCWEGAKGPGHKSFCFVRTQPRVSELRKKFPVVRSLPRIPPQSNHC